MSSYEKQIQVDNRFVDSFDFNSAWNIREEAMEVNHIYDFLDSNIFIESNKQDIDYTYSVAQF